MKYNTTHFIDSDPVQIPHRFKEKNDIEISAFLTSIISWGNRKMIINNADKMMKIMGGSPYDFVINASEKILNPYHLFTEPLTLTTLNFSYI